MTTREIYTTTFDESCGKQSANGCPECDGRVQTNSRETVCEDCGLILSEQAIDRGPEWRVFEDDDEQRERTGAPLTPTRHDDGLSTNIGEYRDGQGNTLSTKKRRHLTRLRREHHRTKRRSKRERNQMQGLFEIDRMAGALGLPESLEERACVLFKSAHEAGLLPGRCIESVATASLYAACRCSETARPLDDLVAVSLADESAVTNAYTVLNRELGLPTPPPFPEAFIPKFVSDLGLDHDVERRAQRVLDVAEQHRLIGGRNPAGVAGACILVAAAEASTVRRPTQQRVSEVTGVTPVTLRARRDELLALRDTPAV